MAAPVYTPEQYRKALSASLENYMPTIKAFALQSGGIVDPQALVRLALICAEENPVLYECSLVSICRSVAMLAEIGLEPGGALQYAALVPYANFGKDKDQHGKVCKPTIMKEGYVELVRRSGAVKKIDNYAVFQGDVFKVFGGDDARILHERLNFNELPEELTFVYSIATLENGERKRYIMPRAKIEKLKAASANQTKFGPWATWYIEMAMTKCVKHFCKNELPKSKFLAKAISFDDAIEMDDDALAHSEVLALDPPSGPESRTDSVMRRMGTNAADAEGFDPLAASKPSTPSTPKTPEEPRE